MTVTSFTYFPRKMFSASFLRLSFSLPRVNGVRLRLAGSDYHESMEFFTGIERKIYLQIKYRCSTWTRLTNMVAIFGEKRFSTFSHDKLLMCVFFNLKMAQNVIKSSCEPTREYEMLTRNAILQYALTFRKRVTQYCGTLMFLY